MDHPVRRIHTPIGRHSLPPIFLSAFEALVLNRAGLGMEVMHERNAHNFPLDLAAAESTSVALQAPAIG